VNQLGARKSSRSLVARLIRAAILWAVPVLVLTAMALTWFYRTSTYRLFDEQLDSTLKALIAAAEPGIPGDVQVVLSREPMDSRFRQILSGRYWVIGNLDDDGKIAPLISSRSLANETLTLPIEDARTVRNSPGVSVRTRADGPDESDPLRVIVKSVIFEDPDRPVVIAAGALSAPAERAVRRFAALAIGLMLLLTGGLIVAVYTQVRVGLGPLFDLRRKVAAVREGRAVHVDGDYPAEIQPLATELNFLIDHNKTVVEQAKTHVGNLAHALKTPLAVLLNEADTPKSNLPEIVTRQSETMKRQVEHHLRRARAAVRGQAIGVSASVSDTLTPLTRTLERIYRDKDIDFDLKVPSGLLFRGEKRDLEEMAGNLLDNACKWTTSKVRVNVKKVPEDDNLLEILVMDDGAGLPEDKFVEALKRGARLDEATPGTGFGLAIVDDLAKAYKGSVTLGRADIGGLSVSLKLPRVV
jgi:signal transduction histidine kinase